MCGIFGIVADNAKSYQENLDKALLSLEHRGPDGSGDFYFPKCALGHRRLSIIDLATGQQPMISDNKKIGLSFNGEIYGYQDIKKQFKGYDFRTSSDTELILALYDAKGIDMMAHLPGMFSFALWDNTEEQLFCARDRFGEKPFFYAIGPKGEFIFASEIKAIIATGLIKPKLNQDSLVHYLQHLYIHPHQTIYSNIFSLPPAHKLIYKNQQIKIEPYWELPKTNNNLTLDEAKDKFSDLLTQSVKKQLVADVPVGTFLSGGLDSSTITAIASKFNSNLQTISYGFGESRNELHFADQVAKKYGTNHLELHDHDYDIAELILMMQDIYDEPFADSSCIPTYLISREAAKHLKVVLTGDGGDELLAGYHNWYPTLLSMSQIENPNAIKMALARLTALLYKQLKLPYDTQLNEYVGMKYKYKYKYKYKSIQEAHRAQNTYFSDLEINNLGLKVKNANNINLGTLSNTVDDALRQDIGDYMPGDILTKIDRASMSNSIELRAPFLDKDFAEFCIALPYQLKINNKEDKIILRRAFSDTWPEEIRSRKKQGFGAPVKKWLEKESLISLKHEYLQDKNKKIFKLLDFAYVNKIITKNNYQTWILLNLSLWLEKHNYDLE